METEEKRCAVNRQLVGLTAKPVNRPLLRTDIDEVIADELEYILAGACCVRGDVAELFDRLSYGSDVRHVLRVDHAACSSRVDGRRARRGGRHTSTRTVNREAFGVCRPDEPHLESVAGIGAPSFISHDMNTQLSYINDLLEKDSELRDVCNPLFSGVLSYQSLENKGRSPRPG